MKMRVLLPGLLLGFLAAGALAAPLTPRRPAAKDGFAGVPPTTPVDSVVVKFHEGTQVRWRTGELTLAPGSARTTERLASLGLTREKVQADLRVAEDLVGSHPLALGLGRLFTAGESALAAARESGEARSGRELADLDLYYRVSLRPAAQAADVEDLVQALNALASVEIAYAKAPPVPPADIPPVTPSFEGSQGYLEAAPHGVDARYAWTVTGGRGQGVKIVDAEGAWNTSHEDLPPLFHQGGTQTTEPGWFPHGTAVLGVMVAPNNGYGVTGIVSGAQAGYESFEGQGSASAIANAALAAGAGGFVLVEMQDVGPSTPSSSCGCSGCCDCVPMEYFPADFDATAQATANGTIVAAAAGNGATNLDDPVYGGVFNRSLRDSGAIFVGASNSTDRSPTCFTNFGSRVDLHGWGGSVTSTGYGTLFNGGGDVNQHYTAGFNGTSSATPIVTGAGAALQGIARVNGGALTPDEIRRLLGATGTPQTIDSRQIGPLPDLRRAIPRMLASRQPSDFWTVTPCRVVDTRTGGPVLQSGVERSFALAGLCGIPASATAVAANVTVVNPANAGFLKIYPGDTNPAGTSVITFRAGQLLSNNAILALGLDGSGEVAALPSLAGGTVHMVIDVTGYFAP